MTEFGPDISSYQHGVNVRALSSRFVLMKCTEGTGYVDADYPIWLAQAKASGKIPIAYHFIGPQDPKAQAAHLAANIIDRSIPVMVDFENEGAFHPTLNQLIAQNDAITAAGLRVRLNYLPRWKWQELGSPNLGQIATRGVGLVSSAYPGGQAYPGDNADGWRAYGGMVPLLYQYTDVAVEGGQTVGDMNAYRGTIEQFAGFLGVSSPAPTPSTSGGTTMGTIPPSIGQKWPDIADQFPSGQTFDNDTALIWSDGGARAAALYALQARDAINALSSRLVVPTIDVNALAAAMSGHVNVTTDVGALAAALIPHLPGSPDPLAFAAALAAHIKVA